MSSQQSSFRDIYGFPSEALNHQAGTYAKKARGRKGQSIKKYKESFSDIVQKAKYVAKFTQNLKQKIAQKGSLNNTLKPNEIEFLQNDSSIEQSNIYFQHDSKFVLGFEIVFIGIMLVQMWKCTFEIVFGDIHQNLICFVTLLVYGCHIFIFNITSFSNQKLEIISNRNEVQELYVTKKLPKDIVFIILLVLQLLPLDLPYPLFIAVRIISLVSYIELSETCEKVENLLSVSTQTEISIAMFKLLFKVALFLHFLSIALNLLVQIESNYVYQTWLTGNKLDYSTNFDKYVIAWYWGATILSTVGFGDITPQNNYERFFISIVQVICCMTIGYFVNVIGSLIKMRAESEEKYEKESRSLNRCLNFISASNELKHKIRTHYFNKHMIQRMHNPNEQKNLFQNLTPNIQRSLLEENNIIVLKKSNVMQKFKEETLLKLAQLMKKVILAPEHILYSKNTVDKKLWFIENGIIEEFTDNFENSKLRKSIYSYNEKEPVVGWINFLTQSRYKSLAKVKIFTIVYELEEDQFLQTLRGDTNQYLKFMQTKHEMIQKKRKFMHKCISCDRYTHNVINCPRIHFVRRDISKLAEQHRNLYNYMEELPNAKKYNRNMIKYDWKVEFASGQLQKQANLLMNNNESVRISNGNIENIFKNIIFRESIVGFEKRKLSFLVSKKENKNQPSQKDSSHRESYQKSGSFDEVITEEEESLMFDRVFFNKQNTNYRPDHDVDKVITLYTSKSMRKRSLSIKIRRFIKKQK